VGRRVPAGQELHPVAGPDGRPPVELGTAEVAIDGSFEVRLPVPSTVPAGEAAVLVAGSLYDDCHDDDSCAGYSAPATIR
jgi:hypothetical protein